MRQKLLLSSIDRVSAELIKILEKKLEIRCVLINKLNTGDDFPYPLGANLIQKSVRSYVGISGDLVARVKLENKAKRQSNNAVHSKVRRGSIASTDIYFFADDEFSEDKKKAKLLDDFWKMNDAAGQLVRGQLSFLSNRCGYWSKWKDAKRTSHAAAIWSDFVFETAWQNVNELPLRASKRVFFDGRQYEFEPEDFPDDYRIVQDKFECFSKRDGLISIWYSQIDDFGSASLHALDYFSSLVTNSGIELVGDKVPPENEINRYEITEDCLSGIELRIFQFLKGRKHMTSYASLRNKIWEKNVLDKSVKMAIERLARSLNTMPRQYFSIVNEYRSQRVKLELLVMDEPTNKPTNL